MGARTPEELESLFEDALVLRDGEAVAALFAPGAALVVDGGQPVRGGAAIACASLATWRGEHIYVAHPQCVVLAHDIALIVAAWGVNVARRDGDGVWRYAIVLQGLEDSLAANGGAGSRIKDRGSRNDEGGE